MVQGGVSSVLVLVSQTGLGPVDVARLLAKGSLESRKIRAQAV